VAPPGHKHSASRRATPPDLTTRTSCGSPSGSVVRVTSEGDPALRGRDELVEVVRDEPRASCSGGRRGRLQNSGRGGPVVSFIVSVRRWP